MEELGESELGTEEYWNGRYKEEKQNFHSHGDVGEIWFGDDIVCRIVKWMKLNVPTTKAILDVGTGNGMLLVELHREGYSNLKGVDYSPEAVQLAKEVATSEGCDAVFELVDILKGHPSTEFDVVLDKGTYDAISLTSDAKANRTTYIENIYRYLKPEGLLLVTSCNWTEDELKTQFSAKFEYFNYIPTPQFKFGGKVGSIVSSVVFKKKLCVEN